MVPRSIRILHAPSPLGLRPPAEGRVPGVRLMPDALRAAGLHRALGAEYAGEVTPPEYLAERHPGLRIRNPYSIAEYSRQLAAALEPLLDMGSFTLVLGGDCSIFLGSALALSRRGRCGVLYLDAHSDCQTPAISQTGGVAGMPLAIATGTGPEHLVALDGAGASLPESQVVLVGCRDLFDVTGGPEKYVAGTRIRVHDLGEVRARGPRSVAAKALDRLGPVSADGIWVHLDADVLDPEIMPAVDSPDPGGLTAAELVDILIPVLEHERVLGMQVTIYDPELDPDRRAAALLVDVLTTALRSARAGER